MAEEPNSSIHLSGIAASPGIHIGRAVIHDSGQLALGSRKVSPAHASREIRKLERSLEAAEIEIVALQDKLRTTLDEAHAAIFDPHLLFVKDPALKEQATRRIRAKHESASYAVTAVIREFANQFAQMEDAYISSRATDVLDVGNRICKHLAARTRSSSHQHRYPSDTILFAHDLTPSDTAQLDQDRIRAFATEIGGPTSHTAILAKAMEIPAVVGLGPIIRRIPPGGQVIVDGYNGEVIIGPTESEVKQARNRRRRHQTRERDLRKLRNLPAETIDGYRVELSANIEFPGEIPSVIEHGAKGIGLFRTEFLYIQKAGLPSEDEQFEVYREVVEKVRPDAVIFRTLDVGGDKFLSEAVTRRELNPFLGLRAIRFCLAHPDIFRTQLRALLRASAYGRTKIMFPLVSSVSEVLEAKKLVRECEKELDAEGKDYDHELEIGVMIEIPSAALTAEQLAQEVDFFSIGTNDLIQYTLAADRSNERVAELYDPYHPAVLKLINQVTDAAQRAGIWVGVCGEMAGNPKTALLLIGMGIHELSMGARSVPEIKYLLRHIRLAEARRIASRVLSMKSSEDIRAVIDAMHDEFRKRRIKTPLPKKEAPSKSGQAA